ncbi:MAG TPA: sodium ion-translocating decarboxylase subunit beta, partial [Desulfobacterales bacterium]
RYGHNRSVESSRGKKSAGDGRAAMPMSARVSQAEGLKYDPGNWLLMHAMGSNLAGGIGSAAAAGMFIAMFK